MIVNTKSSLLGYMDYAREKAGKANSSLPRIMSNIGGYGIAVGHLLQGW